MPPSQRTENAPKRECSWSFLWILAFQFTSFFLILKLFKVHEFKEWQSTVTEVGDRLVNKPWKHKINWPSHPRQQFYLCVGKMLYTFPKPKGSTALLKISTAKNFVVREFTLKLPPLLTVKLKTFYIFLIPMFLFAPTYIIIFWFGVFLGGLSILYWFFVCLGFFLILCLHTSSLKSKRLWQ